MNKAVIIALLFTLSFVFKGFTQSDTTIVQLIQFSDGLDNRRAWRVFPPDTTSYRKILMYQTLKCDPTLISNPTGSGCGEWDAGANFTLRPHHYRDSLRYLVGTNSYPDSLLLSTQPTHTIYRNYQQFIVYDAVLAEVTHAVGSSGAASSQAFQTSLYTSRAQYLYQASELTSAGLSAGTIDKLTFDILSLGGQLNNLTIRMKHTTRTQLDVADYDNYDLQTVYQLNTNITNTGAHTFNLTSAFNWDGTSNIVIDISFTNDVASSDFSVAASTTAFQSGVHATQDDMHYYFNMHDYIDISPVGTTLSDEVTVSFWAFGDPDYLPKNSVVFSAHDTANYRVMDAAVPQGTNEKIRWRAGNAGQNSNTTNNISAASDSAEQYMGRWNHWAFAKNATTGVQKMYYNGQLWQSASSANYDFGGIENFFIGNTAEAGNDIAYKGKINEFRVWNTELDQATIQNWMHVDLNATHPDYANLVGYYKFDSNAVGTTADELGNNDGYLFGDPELEYIDGWEQFRNLSATSTRPDITFTQGSYNTHIDSVLVVDSVVNAPLSVVTSYLTQDFNLIGLQDVYTDTSFYWSAGYNSIYENGLLVDSFYVNENVMLRNWYNEGGVRVGRYITPYGNYLDLGDGFTWIYDVTDFEPYLHDTIDFQGGDARELIDWKFLFISGTPPRDVLEIEEILFSPSNQYEYLVNNPVVQSIEPNPTATEWGLKYSVTGHSFNNPTNCAEFCERTHYFLADGFRFHDWDHFKECADNPLYPQGGTWIYDRTGWCPGEKVDVFDLDLTPYITPGQQIELTYSVDPDPSGTQYGNWSREMFFIDYSAPNHNTDAELYDILAPNNWEYYGRFNPVCDEALIEIRNSGANTIDSVLIEYGVVGAPMQTHMWIGQLEFMKTAVVPLPMLQTWFWNVPNGSLPKFTAKILEVNGGADEYADNDVHYSNFEPTPMYPQDLFIWMKSNSAPFENQIYLWNENDSLIFSRTSFAANTDYKDTFQLEAGCYTLEIMDSGDDGLSFWNNNDGNGFARIREVGGPDLVYFDPDFGKSVVHHFTVGYVLEVEETSEKPLVDIYPNPTSGKVNIEMQSFKGAEITLEVYSNEGRLIRSETWPNTHNHIMKTVYLNEMSAGVYYFKVSDGENYALKQVIVGRSY